MTHVTPPRGGFEFTATRTCLPRLQSILRCGLCQKTVEDAYSLRGCHHDFCRQCLDDWMEEKTVCPQCDHPAWASDMHKNPQLDAIVDAVTNLDRMINNTEEEPSATRSPVSSVSSTSTKHKVTGSSPTSAASLSSKRRSPRGKRQKYTRQQTEELLVIPETVRSEEIADVEEIGEGEEKGGEEGEEGDVVEGHAEKESEEEQEDVGDVEEEGEKGVDEHEKEDQEEQQEQHEEEEEEHEEEDVEEDPTQAEEREVTSDSDVSQMVVRRVTRTREAATMKKRASKRKAEERITSTAKKSECTPKKGASKQKMEEKTPSLKRSEATPKRKRAASTNALTTLKSSTSGSKSKQSTTSKSKAPRVLQNITNSKRDTSSCSNPSGKRRKTKALLPRSPVKRMKRNAKGETPLHVLCIRGDVAAVKELLDGTADIELDSHDNAGWTPLHEASNHGYTDIVTLLLKAGANANMPGFDDQTPLQDAVTNLHADAVKVLLAYGADPDAPDVNGNTARTLAADDEEMSTILETNWSDQVKPMRKSTAQLICATTDRPVVIATTGLDSKDKRKVKEVAASLGAEYSNAVSSSVTHVVAAAEDGTLAKRTMKYLMGVIHGSWMINMKWIVTSQKKEKWVKESPYELKGDRISGVVNVPTKARKNTVKKFPGLFHGCQFFFREPFGAPSRDELISLVLDGDGKVNNREPQFHFDTDVVMTVPYHGSNKKGTKKFSPHYIVYDDKQNAKRKTVPKGTANVVSTTWLLDCVSQFEIIDPR